MTKHLNNIRRTTIKEDGSPATSMYLATIDVLAARADGTDILCRTAGGPIVSWVKEAIIDAEMLGGANYPKAIY